MADDPFGAEDGNAAATPTVEVPSRYTAPIARDDSIDAQWRDAADSEFQRPRISCPVIFSGPTSRVAFDVVQHEFRERGQSKVASASSLALRNVVGVLASSTSHVSSWWSGKSDASDGPSRLVRHCAQPISGLPANPFAERVLENATQRVATAGFMALFADGCLDRSATRLVHVPCLSTWRTRSTGTVVPQRQDALARFVDVTAAAGSVQVVCCSLDHLHLALTAEAKRKKTSKLRIDRGGRAMKEWFGDIDAALDSAYAACKDASSVILFLQQQSGAFSADDLPEVMSTIFTMARISAADRGTASTDASSATRPISCGIAAIVVAKIAFGPATARGAAKGELVATGMEVLCSALNVADGPFRPLVESAAPPSVESAAHLAQVIEALAVHISVSATESPCCMVSQQVLECDAAIRANRDSQLSLTTSVQALRSIMASHGITQAPARVQMLKLLHLWGTIVVPSFDLSVLEDITDDEGTTHSSTVCWQPGVLFDAASSLASRLAPMLRPDDTGAENLGTAEQVQQQASNVGFGALTARFWSGNNSGPTTARQDDENDISDVDRVQDRTCIFTAAEAYLMFAPILQQLFSPVRGPDDIILVSEVETLTDLLSRCGLVIPIRRRKVAARTSSDAAFDDRLQRFLAPPFIARVMPKAIPHFFAVVAQAGGRPSRWVRTNINPCSVLAALSVLLSDRLVLTSVCFGAQKPQNAVSAWANAIVFSSVDPVGRQARTLVAAPTDLSDGSPLPALMVSTVALQTEGDGDAASTDVGFATLQESLTLLAATAMPGLAWWEATPCPNCLKGALPSPDTDWVAGWVSTASSPRETPPTQTSSLLSTSNSVWFFSETVLKEMQEVRRAARSNTSGAATARGTTTATNAFPCPNCSTSLLERSIRARTQKVLVGAIAEEYSSESLPAFLPPICKAQWATLWPLATQPVSLEDAAEADGLFCHAVDSVLKALLFHDTFEKPPPPPPPQGDGDAATAEQRMPTEDEWDHIDEAS